MGMTLNSLFVIRYSLFVIRWVVIIILFDELSSLFLNIKSFPNHFGRCTFAILTRIYF
jgi:hypothetical protein